jgi:hypothetical protein
LLISKREKCNITTREVLRELSEMKTVKGLAQCLTQKRSYVKCSSHSLLVPFLSPGRGQVEVVLENRKLQN